MERQSPPEFEAFWRGLQHGRLDFPYCEACGRFHWYPMKFCPHCGSRDIVWRSVRGDGIIYSWTVIRHPFDQKFLEKLPYAVALVEFPDAPGVRLVTNIAAADVERIAIGTRVRPAVAFSDSAEPMVTFTIAE